MNNQWFQRLALILFGINATLPFAMAQERVYRLGPLAQVEAPMASDVVVSLIAREVTFQVEDPRIAGVQVRITDASDVVLFDSGVLAGAELSWDLPPGRADGKGLLRYTLSGWDSVGGLLGTKIGELNLLPQGAQPEVFDVPGNFTVGGYLGVGTDAPQRAVHLKGPNAVFRLDRTMDAAAFLLVRTDNLGTPLKTFVVGATASGPNQGEFTIDDMGSSIGGFSQNRMKIRNDGDAVFSGSVTATQYYQSSSLRFKENVRPIQDPVAKLEQLRGVQFDWKSTGSSAIGLIAEDVAQVLPEVVSWNDKREPIGVNYGSLVALLVEATKSQQAEIDNLTVEIDRLTNEVRVELDKASRRSTSVR